jgi:hypothetical protein
MNYAISRRGVRREALVKGKVEDEGKGVAIKLG